MLAHQLIPNILGALCVVIFFLFLILTLPFIYIFRLVVILLAKCLKPDFDKILGGINSLFLVDLLANTPPRSNVVISSIFKNQMLCQDFKKVVLKRWIVGKDNQTAYKQFQQFPVKWLGFCFWKNAFHTFSIDNHVHKLAGVEKVITENQLNEAIENLLNSRFTACQSPWEFHVIESYQPPPSPAGAESSCQTGLQSVILMKFHHTLADGFSAANVIAKLFDDQFHNQMNFPEHAYPSKGNNLLHKLKYSLTLPINTFIEGSILFSNFFKNCPWKVADEKKKWYQFSLRTDPIPIQRIKNIKNQFGVSFTSVLLSAVSASIYKNGSIVNSEQGKCEDFGGKQDSVLFMTVLPVPKRRQEDALGNQIAAAFPEIPSKFYGSPLERLKAIDNVMTETKSSVFPLLSQVFPKLVGSHLLPVSRLIFHNRVAPFALTNFPGLAVNFEMNGNPIIDNGVQLGGALGVTGVTIAIISHVDNIRIAVTVEKGLMTREQAKQFVKGITDEIQLLEKISNTGNNNLIC